ncbi:hypothetical protein [Ruminococcus albus]|uniref:Uncharacterized protein n=1 Tax=Ruminococcus albus (strain ATCC 27210 / DSM 20455 / JCM 14654 / NCDO 2250 / 7) TaxID=697329 RepID=E6UIG8_RUMA7|nr:hypothetical protein [Ruminococcus albus]ADU23313.1 hypothetical protein Rumal_2845 [Ruminococcus albus 7 = DSM 20455]
MIDYTFYSRFEGEPEIRFIAKKCNNECAIALWEGYFDRIMSLIYPEPTGWTGIAYIYHMYIGWYDDEIWELKDIRDAYHKFTSINIADLDEMSQKVLVIICAFLKLAIEDGYKVFISRL